jgi:hypothetical protein
VSKAVRKDDSRNTGSPQKRRNQNASPELGIETHRIVLIRITQASNQKEKELSAAHHQRQCPKESNNRKGGFVKAIGGTKREGSKRIETP